MENNQLFRVPRQKRVRYIVHADCKNEADDQYTLVHALLTQMLDVRGVIGGHFDHTDRPHPYGHATATASTAEMEKVLDLMGVRDEVWVATGAEVALADERTPVASDGACLIVEEAMRDDGRPLFIGMQGALTDLASAILMEPQICGRMTCIWVGGGDYPEGSWEFNLNGDVDAANVVLSSSMPLWQVPLGTYKQFCVSLAELQRKVYPCGPVGRYLFEQLATLNEELADMLWPHGETWCLGDEGTIAALLEDHERRDGYLMVPAPRIGKDQRYVPGDSGREIRVYKDMDARMVLEDLFAKLEIYAGR